MATLEIVVPLPKCDQSGTPLEKMPNCPNCGEDELGMVQDGRAVCNVCNCTAIRHVPGLHLLDVPAVCNNCPWHGTVHGCEPTDSGDLSCPQCGEEIVIRINGNNYDQHK